MVDFLMISMVWAVLSVKSGGLTQKGDGLVLGKNG
jgi:hypothetical protein